MSVLAGPCWETGCWPQLLPQNRVEIVEFVVLVRLVLCPGAKEKAMREFLQMQIKQASASHELIFSHERGVNLFDSWDESLVCLGFSRGAGFQEDLRVQLG